MLRRTPMPRKRLKPRRKGGPGPRIKAEPIRDPKHLARVRALGCIVCGAKPAEAHHPRPGQGTGTKAGDDQAIPLCSRHHNEQHPDSWSIHRNPREFRRDYGTEAELLDRTRALLVEAA